eukprot:g6856.t1
MVMAQQNPNLARSRYNAAFQSSIFEPPSEQLQSTFVPAGKRRDQTTAEIFGNYDEKDSSKRMLTCLYLLAARSLFNLSDNMSARQRKYHFLCSEVLPASNYPLPVPEAGEERRASGYPEVQDEDEDPRIDTALVRQMQLSSNMFGRAAEVKPEVVHDPSNRLMPNDFVWHSHPEKPLSPRMDSKTHSDRAYEQKCSQVFEYQSPEVRKMHAAQKMQEKKEECIEEESVLKRRANAFYSDLFGRSAAYDNQEAMLSARRGKNRTSHEEHLIVHQDRARKGQDATPQVRRSEELHQARIFGEENGSWKSPSKLEAVSHDNSEKIKYSDGMSTRQLQQGHLKATLQSDDFYKNASNIKEWEVIELHVSGLPHDADDAVETGGAGRLQQIFEKYGGRGPAIPQKLAAFLGPKHGDRSRSKQSWGRVGHVEHPQQAGSSSISPEVLADLLHEVEGAIATPFGVGVWECQECSCKPQQKDCQAALDPKASHQKDLLDLALLLSGLVSGRAELLRLEGISSNPQLQAELMAADALRIHLGLLERLQHPKQPQSALAEHCRSWRQVLEQASSEQLVGGAWRLVRPGAKQADPLSEEEVLSSLPTARRSNLVFQMPTRLTSRPDITSVKAAELDGCLPRPLNGTPAIAFSAALPPGPCVAPDVVRRSSVPVAFAPSTVGDLSNFWLPDRKPAPGEAWNFSPLLRSRLAAHRADPEETPLDSSPEAEGSDLQSSLPTETPATASPQTPTTPRTPQASEADVTCSLGRLKTRSLYAGARIERKVAQDRPQADGTISPVRRAKSEKTPTQARAWR